ncbi:MAG: SDR family oxidoreductase [Deltaproteobacteria bacterium]|nr:MAG: SDR family oxidoreductase [Deltaproteobacteria bacterium]
MDHDPQDLPRRVREATELLEAIRDDRGLLSHLDKELRVRLLRAAGQISRPSSKERRKLRKAMHRKERQARRDHDEALLERTGIRRGRATAIFATPPREAPRALQGPLDPEAELHQGRSCYVCKERFTQVHAFYDSMCVGCGDENLHFRHLSADLSGRTALLTGGRVKIGYHAGIKLLRAGCRLIVTTRFPADAARRYAAEEDAEAWMDRLTIHGLDLRSSPQVEAFCQRLLREEERLDFLLNNACQTVRRPPGFYAHLMQAEREPQALPPMAQRSLAGPAQTPALEPLRAPSSAELSQIALLPEDLLHGPQIFPKGQLDADLQQVDRRAINSWRLFAHEVPTLELLEVHLVNAVAPFILNARLKPLMERSPERDKHIVNVSAMEGQFYRTFKTAQHPHTNMAKASLNMLTRTSAPDYVRSGIHMNSVDTGWITDEDPEALAQAKREEHRFHPPLDVVDGAARIVHPIFVGHTTGEHPWGQFLKDYRPTPW